LPRATFRFEEKLRNWKDGRTIEYATELIESAVLLGANEESREAAEYVLENAKPWMIGAVTVAKRILGRPVSDYEELLRSRSENTVEESKSTIKLIRKTLKNEMQVPFLWVDLALAYENLGAQGKAERAMKIALSFASSNRFVVRAAARMFERHGDIDYSHEVLRKSQLLLADPWVLAADIAISSKVQRSSYYLKNAMRLLEDDQRFSPFHTAELASAVGSIELENGKQKKGRQLLRASLRQPTENTIAQAAWATRKYGVLIDLEGVSMAHPSAEGRALDDFAAGKWNEALRYSHNWWLDQPFSRRPAILGSYIALLVEDYKRAITISDNGLTPNPDSVMLLNNESFALARSGQLESAENVFAKIPRNQLSGDEEYVWYATSGLLNFRKGNIVEGRKLYQKAIEYFANSQDLRKHGSAFLNYALEEIRVHPEKRSELLGRAKQFEAGPVDIRFTLKRLQDFNPAKPVHP